MHRRVLLLLGAILLLGGIAAACTGDADTGDLEQRLAALEAAQGQDGSGDMSAELALLQDQIIRANMVATLNLLDGVGFHDLNQGIQDGGEAPAGTNGKIKTAIRAVAVTAWPGELDAAGTNFQEKLRAFFDALRGDDPSAVPGAGQVAHDTYHEFTGSAWDYLADIAALGEGGAQEGHDEDMDDMDMGDGEATAQPE